MQNLSAWLPALLGFAIGAVAGFAVRHAKLCSFGAIEDALMGGDGRRLRVFGLALGIAIFGTQALIITGMLNPETTSYVTPALPVVAILVGSIMFGVGMALVGTCGFGSLVRLGAGDLRSLVVVLILGAAAYATLRGILSGLRIGILEPLSVLMPEGARSDIVSLASRSIGIELRAVVTIAIATGLIALTFSDRRLWRAPRLVTAGVVLGIATIAGWIVTTTLGDEFSAPLQPQSLTFVSTIGKTLFAGLLNVANFADFGVASVLGVIAGSFLAAWRAVELRWEAFDDDHEMRRHLTGAALMGIGGILAGGCTIGQGITAGSILALSSPLAVAGMMLGSRIGIAVLVDGSLRDIFERGWTELLRGKGRY